MDLVSSSQTSFTGDFRHQLDDKNRITVPSRWRRKDKSEEVLLLPEQKLQCLLVMTPPEFARLIASADTIDGASPIQRRVFLRQLHARAAHAAIDKQGRLLLPDDLCQQLELKGEVALVGGAGRFEIWNLARWKRALQEEQSTYEHVANLFGL